MKEAVWKGSCWGAIPSSSFLPTGSRDIWDKSWRKTRDLQPGRAVRVLVTGSVEIKPSTRTRVRTRVCPYRNTRVHLRVRVPTERGWTCSPPSSSAKATGRLVEMATVTLQELAAYSSTDTNPEQLNASVWTPALCRNAERDRGKRNAVVPPDARSRQQAALPYRWMAAGCFHTSSPWQFTDPQGTLGLRIYTDTYHLHKSVHVRLRSGKAFQHLTSPNCSGGAGSCHMLHWPTSVRNNYFKNHSRYQH